MILVWINKQKKNKQTNKLLLSYNSVLLLSFGPFFIFSFFRLAGLTLLLRLSVWLQQD